MEWLRWGYRNDPDRLIDDSVVWYGRPGWLQKGRHGPDAKHSPGDIRPHVGGGKLVGLTGRDVCRGGIGRLQRQNRIGGASGAGLIKATPPSGTTCGSTATRCLACRSDSSHAGTSLTCSGPEAAACGKVDFGTEPLLADNPTAAKTAARLRALKHITPDTRTLLLPRHFLPSLCSSACLAALS